MRETCSELEKIEEKERIVEERFGGIQADIFELESLKYYLEFVCRISKSGILKGVTSISHLKEKNN